MDVRAEDSKNVGRPMSGGKPKDSGVSECHNTPIRDADGAISVDRSDVGARYAIILVQ